MVAYIDHGKGFGLRSLCVSRMGHKQMGKNLVHNFPYGPRTWLVRGIDVAFCVLGTFFSVQISFSMARA